MRALVDDLVDRDYFGVILTGGEPSLHPELPEICRYARDQGLHVRMITNGHRLADPSFAKEMADAGLQLVHVSVYSNRPEIEAKLRGITGTLEKAYQAIENAHAAGIEVNINCVINQFNADHLDENIRYWNTHHPYIRHFIWNNLDPSMGRAETNMELFTPRLQDFEESLYRALKLLHESKRSFRVEKVPLCYMADFAWASTETRKIVKLEERVVHFLDDKQTVRQENWDHLYAEACKSCTLRPICGGLFDRGQGYDPAELTPVFLPLKRVVETILNDPSDPSYHYRSFEAWQEAFEAHQNSSTSDAPREPSLPQVGTITSRSLRLYESKRNREAEKAANLGLRPEKAAPSDCSDS